MPTEKVHLPPCEQEQLSQTATLDREGGVRRQVGLEGPGIRLPGGLRVLQGKATFPSS